MSALQTARITPLQLSSQFQNRVSRPMAATTTLFLGSLVCENASGYLVKGSVATTLRAVGIVAPQPREVPSNKIVNSGSAGDKLCDVYYQPVAKLNNDPDDPVLLADLETQCFILDDQTVSKTSGGTKSPAGRVVGIDDDTSPTGPGVWVLIGATAWNVAGSAGAQGATGPQGTQGPQGPQGAPGA